MKKIIILILTILSLNSCQQGNEQKTIAIDNRYSIAIPSFLTEAHGLNEEASLQYQHVWKGLYVIVLDEPIAEMAKALDDNNLNESYNNDIKGYSDLIMNGFEQTISVTRRSEFIDTVINNMPARLLTVSGRAEGTDAFYSLAFIQGKQRYYQIMAWTLPDKEHEYKARMNQMMFSLKEL